MGSPPGDLAMKFPRPRLLRPGEGRLARGAFGFLAVFFAGQSALEAARDALFLSHVPARHLPWMYIAIAVLSFAVARAEERLGRRMDSGDALRIWVLVSGLGTVALAAGAVFHHEGEPRPLGVYVTYVWSALITSLVVARFWALLGGMFSITDAKRLYGLIGAGSVTGAIAGSGLAGLTAALGPPELLLWLAGALFLTAALVAHRLQRVFGRTAPLSAATPVKLSRALALFQRDGYPQRVVVMLVLAAAGLTFADFAFKSVVVERVPKDQLGLFFGILGVVGNSLSLLVQLVLGPRLISALGVCGALVVLPALLGTFGLGMAAGLGVGAAVAVRVGDGALRYSLHRTAAELLFVPMSAALRGAMKVLDTLGQRLGQALASVALLACTYFGAPDWLLAVALVLAALIWAGAALELRRYYLDVFRSDLKAGRLGDSVRVRGLDQAALETLLAVLDSGDDAEALAALAVLAKEQKAHLVPGLILYHPSIEVVWTAAELFIETRRLSVLPLLDRLATDPSEERRGAAIVTRAMLKSDRRQLEALLERETSPELIQLLRFLLLRHGVGDGAVAQEIVAAVKERGSERAKLWVAAAIALDPSPLHEEVLVELAQAEGPMVRRVMPRLLAQKGTPGAIAALVRGLADEGSRDASIRGLTTLGEPGLEALLAALADDRAPASITWHVPRALTYFPPQRVLPALLAQMESAQDGMVRFRCLRAIERLVALDSTVTVDRRPVAAEAKRAVARAAWCLSRRAYLRAELTAAPERGTVAQALIGDLLRDKEHHALDRALRALGILQRSGDFTDVRRGLASDDPHLRASAIELLGHVVPSELKGVLLALVLRAPDAERLELMGPDRPAPPASYRAALEEIARSGDKNLAELAAYHQAELTPVATPPSPAVGVH